MKNWIPLLRYDTLTNKRIPDPEEENELPYDEEAFAQTDIGRELTQNLELYRKYSESPMHPEVIAYWEKRGLKKELFDYETEEGKYAYSVFTPLDMKTNKKYAMIYFSHGGGVTINLAETYGFNTLAAVEKYIVVYPNNGGRSNNEVDTEFPRIMEALREKKYPIDWERVYCAGFSSGSEASVCAACTCPEMAAAVAVLPGGQPFKDLKFHTGPDYYASTKGLRIPGIFIGGTADVASYPAPWILDNKKKDYRVHNLDIWMRDIAQIKNYRPLSSAHMEELLANSQDPVEREFGLEFDISYSFHVQGADWLGGEFYGKDGAPVMRYARAIGIPHVVLSSQANLAWDYLKHFRRDQDTGESIYDPVICWGER